MDTHRTAVIIITLVVTLFLAHLVVVVIILIVKRLNTTMNIITMRIILHGKSVKTLKHNNINIDIITQQLMTIHMSKLLLLPPQHLHLLLHQQQQQLHHVPNHHLNHISIYPAIKVVKTQLLTMVVDIKVNLKVKQKQTVFSARKLAAIVVVAVRLVRQILKTQRVVINSKLVKKTKRIKLARTGVIHTKDSLN